MSGLINELIAVLEEQAKNYENLDVLSLEKKEAILENDIDSLQKITKVESLIIGKNQNLEKKRIKINKDIALVLNIEEESLTILVLHQLIKGQKEEPLLMEIVERIRIAVNHLKITNEDNKTLLNFSLDYIDFTMNLLRGTVFNILPNCPLSKNCSQYENTLFDVKQ